MSENLDDINAQLSAISNDEAGYNDYYDNSQSIQGQQVQVKSMPTHEIGKHYATRTSKIKEGVDKNGKPQKQTYVIFEQVIGIDSQGNPVYDSHQSLISKFPVAVFDDKHTKEPNIQGTLDYAQKRYDKSLAEGKPESFAKKSTFNKKNKAVPTQTIANDELQEYNPNYVAPATAITVDEEVEQQHSHSKQNNQQSKPQQQGFDREQATVFADKLFSVGKNNPVQELSSQDKRENFNNGIIGVLGVLDKSKGSGLFALEQHSDEAKDLLYSPEDENEPIQEQELPNQQPPQPQQEFEPEPNSLMDNENERERGKERGSINYRLIDKLRYDSILPFTGDLIASAKKEIMDKSETGELTPEMLKLTFELLEYAKVLADNFPEQDRKNFKDVIQGINEGYEKFINQQGMSPMQFAQDEQAMALMAERYNEKGIERKQQREQEQHQDHSHTQDNDNTIDAEFEVVDDSDLNLEEQAQLARQEQENELVNPLLIDTTNEDLLKQASIEYLQGLNEGLQAESDVQNTQAQKKQQDAQAYYSQQQITEYIENNRQDPDIQQEIDNIYHNANDKEKSEKAERALGDDAWGAIVAERQPEVQETVVMLPNQSNSTPPPPAPQASAM